jgi:EAL domain-containing protein (putative c-di-GMP-specific phosphodiesterase class I)
MALTRFTRFISRHRQGLGLTIAADGIVTAGQSALLALSGCQQGQGDWSSGLAPAGSTDRLYSRLRAPGARSRTGRSSDW